MPTPWASPAEFSWDGVRENGPMSAAKLSGHLLLATPQIDDGIFFRSVILLLHHDQDGAQGVIVNLPLDSALVGVAE